MLNLVAQYSTAQPVEIINSDSPKSYPLPLLRTIMGQYAAAMPVMIDPLLSLQNFMAFLI